MTLNVDTAINALNGVVRGRIDLPLQMLTGARRLAQEHYAHCEQEEFSGTAVEDYLFPAWALLRWSQFPYAALAQLGYQPVPSTVAHCEALYATVAAPEHVDDICGPNFILCLHNDGLRFRMGDVEHETAAGEWFLFDDRLAHEVLETDTSGTYLVWSVGLRPLHPQTAFPTLMDTP